MSKITELIERLRNRADVFERTGWAIEGLLKDYREAADTIEELSAKLQAANMERSSKYYNGGWIPVSERLPEEPFGCFVTVMDTNPLTMEEFENVLPYFVGWDGEQWNDADGEQCPFEVIAWQRVPEPYKESEECKCEQ